jgi:cytochrome c-type biogenesis protein CcmE
MPASVKGGPVGGSAAPGAEGKEVSDDKDDFEQADAAADAALEYARSLPPGIARSQAFKAAGKLRSAAD